MDQLWQLREKAQKKVMEVGGDVSNGLLSVETKSRQRGERGEEIELPPPHLHQRTLTHTHTHDNTHMLRGQLNLPWVCSVMLM